MAQPAFISRPARLYLLSAGFYALLAFIILHTLIFYNGTHVAGFDYFNYNWNFWWIRHALTTPGLNIYESNYVMAPHVNNFGYHALTMVWYPVWALVEPVAGTLTAVNVIIFLGCFLNGYMLFLLLRREGASPGLALLGGAVLQMLPVSRYFYYNTHLNLMDWFWLPTTLLLWGQIVRTVEARNLPRAVLWSLGLGVVMWGVGLTDLQFPIFVGFLLVPYGVWTLIRAKNRLGLVGAGAIVLVITALLLWFAGPLPYMLRFKGTLAPGTALDRPGIPLRGYLALDPVWWWWDTPTLGGTVLVLTILALVVSLMRWRKRLPASRWFWFIFLLPPLILSMGPTLMMGSTEIPLPFRLMHAVTNGNFRMPWRLAPIFAIAAMVFVAKTWTPLLRTRRNLALFGLAGVFLLMGLDMRLYETPPMAQTFRPQTLSPIEPVLPSYDLYKTIGQEQGAAYDNLVLLEVPTGASSGEVIVGDPRASQFQFYGMTHGKRMLDGFISRAPLENFYPLNTDDPLLAWLGQRRYLEPETDEAELRQIIQDWPLGYIVVHQDFIGRNGSTPQEIIGWLNALPDLVCPILVEKDAVLYRTSAHPDGCPARTPPETEPGVYTVDIGTSGDERFIGWGWHWPEEVAGLTLRWNGEYPQTKIYADIPTGGYEVSLSAQAFWETRHLRVLVNDVLLGEVDVQTDTLQTFSFDLPADVVGNGEHVTLTLDYDAVIVPKDVGQSDDPRKLALAVDWVKFTRVQ